MTTKPKLLTCYSRDDMTPEYSVVSIKTDTIPSGNNCDETNNLPQINTVLPKTTYRVNYFIHNKKKRLLRIDRLNRKVKNSKIESLMPGIRRDGFLRNMEVIPAFEALKQIPNARFIDAKTDQLVLPEEITEDDFLIVDGQHRLEIYFRLDAEAGMRNEKPKHDLLVSIIKIPDNVEIKRYMYAVNTFLNKWDAQDKTGYMVESTNDPNTGLYHALRLMETSKIGIRYATALFQFHDGFKTTMQTQYIEGEELHPFLKSTPDKIARGLKLFESFRVGFHSKPQLLKNMAALNFVISIYNDTRDEDKSIVVENLCLFFQSLSGSDVKYLSEQSIKEYRQNTLRNLWNKFINQCEHDPEFSNQMLQRADENRKSLEKKDKKDPKQVAHENLVANKKDRKTKLSDGLRKIEKTLQGKPIQKTFHGKALYEPSGKAAEYSSWAVNFYNGCENNCDYCYCKKGVLGRLWANEPQLKKCFKDEEDALQAFQKELMENHGKVSEHGILFSFTTDPMLPKTWGMTFEAMEFAVRHNVPVQVLTKRTDWMEEFDIRNLEGLYNEHKDKIAFGFTLTGRDDLEPNASSNADRIEAMRKLHAQGFKTFASIEPVVEPLKSIEMIEATKDCCDVFKVGLMSGKKDYDLEELKTLFSYLKGLTNSRIYLKDSFAKTLFIKRDKLPEHFVNADFNIFKNQ